MKNFMLWILIRDTFNGYPLTATYNIMENQFVEIVIYQLCYDKISLKAYANTGTHQSAYPHSPINIFHLMLDLMKYK